MDKLPEESAFSPQGVASGFDIHPRRGWMDGLVTSAEQRGYRAALEEAAAVAETLPIGGGTLSSWVNTNESPMGATRRHIGQAIRNLMEKE
jgi:hypothetical protein